MKKQYYLLFVLFCFFVTCTKNDEPLSTNMGSVMFWAKTACAPDGQIVYTINNITDTIKSLSDVAPSPNTPVKFVALPVGNYSWSAHCGADSIKGTLVVAANKWNILDVSFAAKPVADTQYIKYKANDKEGVFLCPPDSVVDARFEDGFTSLLVEGSYGSEMPDWYGILFKGPASAEGDHSVVQLKLPGMVAGMDKSDTLKVTIAKYGVVGERIEGSFKGKVLDDADKKYYDIDMRFSVKRLK